MDNATLGITAAEINVAQLKAALGSADIPVSHKTIPRKKTEQITFSRRIGKHQRLWMIRIDLKTCSIACSGGVTKTLFGHNVWVGLNERAQLNAIASIVAADLAKIDGITLPPSPIAVAIERVELTRHHELPVGVTQAEAIERLNTLFKTLFPNRRFRNGDTHDLPGTTGIGLTKSSKALRAYDPIEKFYDLGNKPEHIPVDLWLALKEFCARHLRVEIMFSKRELQAAGLSTIDAWSDTAKIDALVAKRYKQFGLSVQFKATNVDIIPADVAATNPTFVEYARYFFSGGERGSQPDDRSRSKNRFKQYMAARGYCVDVAFDRHIHLVHGLHEILQPSTAVMLPDELRLNPLLFGRWWETTQGLPTDQRRSE